MKVYLKDQNALQKSIENKFSFDSFFIRLQVTHYDSYILKVLEVGLSFDKLFDFFWENVDSLAEAFSCYCIWSLDKPFIS